MWNGAYTSEKVIKCVKQFYLNSFFWFLYSSVKPTKPILKAPFGIKPSKKQALSNHEINMVLFAILDKLCQVLSFFFNRIIYFLSSLSFIDTELSKFFVDNNHFYHVGRDLSTISCVPSAEDTITGTMLILPLAPHWWESC